MVTVFNKMARLKWTATSEENTQNNVERIEIAKPPKTAKAEPAMLEAAPFSPADGLAANPPGDSAAVILKSINFNNY